MGWGEPIEPAMSIATVHTVSCRARTELAYVLGYIEATPIMHTASLSVVADRIDALGIPADFDPDVEPDWPSFQARDATRPERVATGHLAEIRKVLSDPMSVAFIQALQKARAFLDLAG